MKKVWNWIKKAWNWFKQSNRWKHFAGGVAIGLGSDDWYCATYAGIAVAGALEFKDYQWGGKPDWIDFTLTVTGALVGYTIRWIIAKQF